MKKLFILLLAVLAAVFPPEAEACTTAIVSAEASASGRPLLWKQRDTDNPHNVVAYVSGGKYAYTAVFNASDKNHRSAYSGANEAGFAIMNNLSYNLADSTYSSVVNGRVIAEALAKCRTLDDFQRMLEQWPKPRNVEANFGVIDAFGGAAYFEVGDTKVVRYDVEPGNWLVRTNFSLAGREHEGSGMARYETAQYLMSQHTGKFTPEFLIDGLGRSFYNAELGADMRFAAPAGVAVDLDFIPRTSSVSSVCIEGVGPGDDPGSSILWTAIGYTPCCYAVPVWVAAGEQIPVFLLPDKKTKSGSAPANLLAEQLLRYVHPADRDARTKYIDFRRLQPILQAVWAAEATEVAAGRELDDHMRRTGFDTEAVRRYNREAENRFDAFRAAMAPEALERAAVGPVRDGALTPDMLTRLAAAASDVPERVGSRFLTRDLYKASLNEAVAAAMDTTCTLFVPSRGVTDQDESGRCWLFSTLNILRAEMITRYDLGPFQFSQTYGQFYDILEKSNRCLENVIAHRNEPMESRYNTWLFNKPIGDGGHFANAAHLIAKYGMVPQEVMPERFSSTDNVSLMKTVTRLLRRYGLQLREASGEELQAVKEQALTDIYRLLVATLGEPPQEFDWIFRDKRGRVLSVDHYTPQSFRDAFIRHDMEADYAIFMDDPTLPYYRMYEVEDSRNCYEYANWRFLNVPMSDIRKMGVASLAGGRRFYISADTMHDYLMTDGIYDTELFALDSLLGIHSTMSKEELVRSVETHSVHAIAVAGVKLDAAGEPVKWVIENSYGLVRGWGGYVAATDPWFCKYLYRLVVEKQFVDKALLEKMDGPVEKLPAWYPNY
jgi:bleomycin hydrolase